MTGEHGFQQLRAESRREAEEFAAKAGASIDVREEFVELPGGGVKQVFRWRAQKVSPNDGVDLVLKAGGVPFADAAGVVRLRVPWAPGDRRTPREWPTRGWQTAAGVATLVYEASRRPLCARELNEVLLILEGKALAKEPPEILEDWLERDILLRTLVALLKCESRWIGSATRLLQDLNFHAKFCGNDPDLHADWPASGSSLSVRLESYHDAFALLGIMHEYKRTAYCRTHILSYPVPRGPNDDDDDDDDRHESSSLLPSLLNASVPMSSESNDDDDDDDDDDAQVN